MNKREFVNGVLELELSFDNFEISKNKEKISYWYNYFKNIDNELFIRGVRNYITKERYKPTISALFERIKEMTPDAYYTADDEWLTVKNLVLSKNLKRYEIMDILGEDSVTFRALDKVGVKTINKSMEDELKYLRHDFINYFIEMKENELYLDLKSGDLNIYPKDNYHNVLEEFVNNNNAIE